VSSAKKTLLSDSPAANASQKTSEAAGNGSGTIFGRSLVMIVVSFFIGCSAFFVFILGTTAWHELHPSPEVRVADVLADSPENAAGGMEKVAGARNDLLSLKLDAYNKRVEDLEKLASFLTGLSVLYALALGVTSYIALQNNLQQAKAIGEELNALREKAVTQLAEAKSKATEIMGTISDEFPLFGFVDTNLRRITKDVLEIMPFKGWSDEIYAKLQPQRIEAILYYEKTAASLEFFYLGALRADVSRIYQRLGVFYALKCQHQRKELRQDSPLELARSKFYLDRATDKNPDNFAAWNDRAWVALVLDQPASLALAKQFSQSSLTSNDKHQRAHYNLSVAEHLSGNYSAAEEWLSRALQLKDWEEDEEEKDTRRLHNLYYNRACARGRLSQKPENDSKHRASESLLQEALEDLEDAFSPDQLEYWDTPDWKSVAADCLKGGDLEPVRKKYPKVIKGLLSQNFPGVSQAELSKELKRLEEDLTGG
jgi:hypothetical protein